MVTADQADTGVSDEKRFAIELEFVQCLANPHYLNWLAQRGYFDDPAFLAYLKYLLYWKEPPYVQYVIYPHALKMLDLVQTPEFRSAIGNPAYKEMVHSQQLYFWQHWRENRLKDLELTRLDPRQSDSADNNTSVDLVPSFNVLSSS